MESFFRTAFHSVCCRLSLIITNWKVCGTEPLSSNNVVFV